MREPKKDKRADSLVRICRLCRVKVPGDDRDWNRHIRGRKHRRNLSFTKQINETIPKKDQHVNTEENYQKWLDAKNLTKSQQSIEMETEPAAETEPNPIDDDAEALKIAIELSLNDKNQKEKKEAEGVDLAIAMSLQEKTQQENEGMDLAIAMSLQDEKQREVEEFEDLEIQYILSQSIYQDVINEDDLPDDEDDYLFEENDEFDAEAF